MDPAIDEDEAGRSREEEEEKNTTTTTTMMTTTTTKKKKKKREKGRKITGDHEERNRFLLVALSPGCRVILPYYYPLLMPAALCRGEREQRARDERKRARRNKIDRAAAGQKGEGRSGLAEKWKRSRAHRARCREPFQRSAQRPVPFSIHCRVVDHPFSSILSPHSASFGRSL